MLIYFITAVMVFSLLFAALVLRSSRHLQRERDRFQRQLQEQTLNLEQPVRDRTAELQQEIAERKQTQDLLTEQTQFLTNIIESLPHPFYVVDTENYQVVLANSAAGVVEKGEGKTCHQLTHNMPIPCSGSEHPCPLELIKQTRKPVMVEHVHTDPNGEEIIVEVHGYPVFDAGGSLKQMIEYSLDITDKKRAEKELLEVRDQLEEKVLERTRELESQIRRRQDVQHELAISERHYRRLIENISDVITIVDASGFIRYVSPSVEKQFGLPPEEIVSSDIRNFIHDEDVQNLDMQNLYEQHPEGIPMVHRVVGADGNVRVMETTIHRFEQENGDKEFILNSRNITERKAAEEGQKKFRLVVEQSPSSIVITDKDGIIEYVNPAFVTLTGYSAEEIVGNNPRILKSGKTPEQVFDEMWQTIKAGRIWQGEFINRKKSLEIYEEAVQVVPILDSWGKITNFVAIKENITALKRARYQAETANRAKSRFLSRMSHELRTPLNAINGFSQLMLKSRKNPLNDKQQEMVGQIHSAGAHLLELINEVLDLARIESGEMSLDIEALDPRLVIDDCLALIEPLAREHNIDLTCAVGDELPLVRADRVRLKQVLLNLLSNAVKYNQPKGEVQIRTGRKQDGFLQFEVEDNGIGIAEDKQADIFTPFSRVAENSNLIEGSGIGLTIARQLVEVMGGDISFESHYGEGSRFWFSLPLSVMVQRAEVPAKQAANELGLRQLTADESTLYHVLYIEDNRLNVEFMRDYMAELGQIDMKFASTGEEGVALARQIRPDLILLDLNLPKMDGYQTFSRLREDVEMSSVPVVAVSGDVMDATIEKVKTAGFTDFLPKPIDTDRFCKILREALGMDI